MKAKLNGLIKEERGITALETAIMLIAFVVIATIFAFTVLTTGTSLTEASKQAAYSGLLQVSSAMQLEGSVVLLSTGTTIVFNLAPVTGGSYIDLTQLNIVYRDTTSNTNLSYIPGNGAPGANQWTATNPAGTTPALILSSGQLVKITVSSPVTIHANQTFSLEVTPATGAVLLVQRTAPAQITQVTDLH